MPGAWGVDLAELHVDTLPAPEVLRHVGPRLIAISDCDRGNSAGTSVDILLHCTRSLTHLGLKAVGGPLELGLRPEQDPVDVVQAAAVEAAEDVHVAAIHHSAVERARRWRFAKCRHPRPAARVEAELAEVGKSRLPFVHASEDEHATTVDHGVVTVPRRGHLSATWNAVPLIGRHGKFVQVVQRIVAVPAAEHEHACAVNDRGVAEAAHGSIVGDRNLGPLPLLDLVLVQVRKARSPVEAAEDEQARLVNDAGVVGANAGTHGAVEQGPVRIGDVELEQVVEVVPVLLGVATEVEDAIAADNGLGT
mmetsp:Transcript_14499/g.41679  ORF Transcript_14499/g.41679 Transcript_14499/m.41679 type:complete len:307 (+) Transcript_14499:807-1727(+)